MLSNLLFFRNYFFPALLSLLLIFVPENSAIAQSHDLSDRMLVTTATGKHTFTLEIAKTNEERAKGLMFRKSMPQDHGMLFIFHDARPISMWMKNTLISLDMIFVSGEGMVTSIIQHTTPLSEEIITSDQPAQAVIEVNAGVAQKIGLAPGDKIHHPLFPIRP
ncbi:MAG: DUF192 domain-containing protein [Methylocystis sp.]